MKSILMNEKLINIIYSQQILCLTYFYQLYRFLSIISFSKNICPRRATMPALFKLELLSEVEISSLINYRQA